MKKVRLTVKVEIQDGSNVEHATMMHEWPGDVTELQVEQEGKAVVLETFRDAKKLDAA